MSDSTGRGHEYWKDVLKAAEHLSLQRCAALAQTLSTYYDRRGRAEGLFQDIHDDYDVGASVGACAVLQAIQCVMQGETDQDILSRITTNFDAIMAGTWQG
jgi:hypothetical protein